MWTSSHQFTRFCFTIDKGTWGFIEISISIVIAACEFHVKQYTVITTFTLIVISSSGGDGGGGSSSGSLTYQGVQHAWEISYKILVRNSEGKRCLGRLGIDEG